MSDAPKYFSQDEDGIPTDDKELIQWLKNFIEKFPVHAPTLGFSTQEIEDTVNKCTQLLAALINAETAQHAYEEAKGFRTVAMQAISREDGNN